MAHGLPCLNPTCDYEFSQSEIEGAAALTCPHCGNVFQIDSSAAAPPVAARVVPQARRVAPPPGSVPPAPLNPGNNVDVELVQPAQPALPPQPVYGTAGANGESVPSAIVAGEGHPQANEFAAGSVVSSPTLASQRLPMERWKLGIIVGSIILGVVGLPILIVMIVFFAGKVGTTGPLDGDKYTGEFYNIRRSPEKAFQIIVPYQEIHYDTWKSDRTIKKRLGASIVLERQVVAEGAEEPDTIWLAVAGKDYGQQRPRDSELLKRAIQRLEKCFGENLALEAEPTTETLDDRPAQVLEFVGKLNSVTWEGYCYTFTHHGFGYWVFVAGTNKELARKTFLDLQKQNGFGFHAATIRGGWRSRPPEMATFVAAGAPLRLSAPRAIWSQFKGTEEDKNGVLLLIGKDKTEGYVQDPNHNLRNAQILVLRLDRKTRNLRDALATGKKYVAEAYKKEKEVYELKPVKKGSPEDGVLFRAGKEQARVLEMKLINSDGEWKYLLLAVVRQPDRIYIIRCDSRVEYHQAWRGEFLEILKTLQID